MANNGSIQFLRKISGTVTDDDIKSLLPGQPLVDFTNKRLFIGTPTSADDPTNGVIMIENTRKIELDDLADSVRASLTKADNAIPSNTRGQANGVASLDGNGRVPEKQGFLAAHPVECLYPSNIASSPAAQGYGGNWEELPEGTFIRAAGSGGQAGQTGGNATVSLTADNVASHKHEIYVYTGANIGGEVGTSPSYGYVQVTATKPRDPWTMYTGGNYAGRTATNEGGTPFSIIPPYRTTHIWRRTA